MQLIQITCIILALVLIKRASLEILKRKKRKFMAGVWANLAFTILVQLLQ